MMAGGHARPCMTNTDAYGYPLRWGQGPGGVYPLGRRQPGPVVIATFPAYGSRSFFPDIFPAISGKQRPPVGELYARASSRTEG